MVVPGWRRSRPSISRYYINAVGCKRCAIFWRRCASRTTTRSKPVRKPFTRCRARKRRNRPAAALPDGDLLDLLSFYIFPEHLWRKLRTTNIIERCFVEVRRRTRPMVCFVNVKSVDRIIYSIFQRFNLEWANRTFRVITQAA